MVDQSFWKPGSIVKLQEPYRIFTHGIIAQVYAHDHKGNVSHVSLHLYSPEKQTIYIDNVVGIPTYVDYHVSELIPYKDGSLVGYEVIRTVSSCQ